MPRQPPAHRAPVAYLWSYPALSICGKASRPIRVTTAPTMPVAVAKSAHVMMAATASAPGRCRAATCRLKNSRSRIFARSTMYPMNRNRGIDTSVSLVITP